MTTEQYDYLLKNEPPHMYPVTVNLEGNETAIAIAISSRIDRRR